MGSLSCSLQIITGYSSFFFRSAEKASRPCSPSPREPHGSSLFYALSSYPACSIARFQTRQVPAGLLQRRRRGRTWSTSCTSTPKDDVLVETYRTSDRQLPLRWSRQSSRWAAASNVSTMKMLLPVFQAPS
jgi:hypothetical protein